MPKLRLFVDMDGTLARFHDEPTYLERMFEKGFFEDLKPFEDMVNAVNQIVEMNIAEVYILSSVINSPWCESEKNKWLDKYLPNIDMSHRIYAVGAICPKSLYVPDAFIYHNEETGESKSNISKYNILLDDYNKNLSEWQAAGGTAIKAKNNFNHKGLIGELWQGELTDITASAADIVDDISKIAAPLMWAEECTKRVLDEDGAHTDYTLYSGTTPLNFGKYITVFGDKEIFNPYNANFNKYFDDKYFDDKYFDDIKSAYEWFDNYEGFSEKEEDEEDEEMEM